MKIHGIILSLPFLHQDAALHDPRALRLEGDPGTSVHMGAICSIVRLGFKWDERELSSF